MVEHAPDNLTHAPAVELIGHDGKSVELASLYANQPLVLQFSRHLGCVFCTDHARLLLQHYEELSLRGLQVALVIMGSADDARDFQERLGLSYPVFADPQQKVYQAFDVPRGNWWQVAGPHLWWQGFRALLRSGFGRPRGDLLQLSGTYLIATNGTIAWKSPAENSAQFPNLNEMMAVAQDLLPKPEDG